jgi:MFS family permease
VLCAVCCVVSFGAGLLFSCFNLPYALCGLCMGRLSTLLTPRCLMTRGLLLISLGLAMLGPPPVLVHGSLGGEWGLWLLWGGSVLGMAMLGTGQAWIVMPSLDVMKDQCKAVGRAQGQEEILAGLMNYAISAGAVSQGTTPPSPQCFMS